VGGGYSHDYVARCFKTKEGRIAYELKRPIYGRRAKDQPNPTGVVLIITGIALPKKGKHHSQAKISGRGGRGKNDGRAKGKKQVPQLEEAWDGEDKKEKKKRGGGKPYHFVRKGSSTVWANLSSEEE